MADFSGGQCVVCGAPAHAAAAFSQNIGMLVMRRTTRVAGLMCSSCVHTSFWTMTLVTALVGWFGLISAIVTPFIVLGNIGSYLAFFTGYPALLFSAAALGGVVLLGFLFVDGMAKSARADHNAKVAGCPETCRRLTPGCERSCGCGSGASCNNTRDPAIAACVTECAARVERCLRNCQRW